jgi:hypothetical protein
MANQPGWVFCEQITPAPKTSDYNRFRGDNKRFFSKKYLYWGNFTHPYGVGLVQKLGRRSASFSPIVSAPSALGCNFGQQPNSPPL